jgi:hypothetical protein
MKSRFLLAVVMLLGLPAIGHAQEDMQITPQSSAMPDKGVAVYTGTYTCNCVPDIPVSGSIEIDVDFQSHTVSANLTIPSFPLGASGSPTLDFTPTGLLTSSTNASVASRIHDTYTLTQGVTNSVDQPYISLSGSFSGPHGEQTAGSFIANFCYQSCFAGSGIYVVHTISGTFSATAQN